MTEDLMQTKAMLWFHSNGHRSVMTVIRFTGGVYVDAPDGGYSGRDSDGNIVALVALDELKRMPNDGLVFGSQDMPALQVSKGTVNKRKMNSRIEIIVCVDVSKRDAAISVIEAAMLDDMRFGVTGWDMRVDDDAVALVSLDEIERETKQPIVNPLLVVSHRELLGDDKRSALEAAGERIKDKAGWLCVVVDGMDEAKVQAFGIDAPALDTLSTDDVIEMLEALKRGREGQGAIEGGSISRS